MRSAALLLAGLALAGTGVGVLFSHLPGRWWLGAALVVAGVLLKVGGFLHSDEPTRSRVNGRAPATTRNGAGEMSRANTRTGPTVRPLHARAATSRKPSRAPSRTSRRAS